LLNYCWEYFGEYFGLHYLFPYVLFFICGWIDILIEKLNDGGGRVALKRAFYI